MQDGRGIKAEFFTTGVAVRLTEPRMRWFELRLGAEKTPDGDMPARWLRRSAPTALDARRQVLVAGYGKRILEVREVLPPSPEESSFADFPGPPPLPGSVEVPRSEWAHESGEGWYSEMEVDEFEQRIETPLPGDHSLIGGLLAVEGEPWRYYWSDGEYIFEMLGSDHSAPIDMDGYIYVVGPNGPIHRQ